MLDQTTLRIKTPEAFEKLLAPARYKGAYGGRGSGKSHFFAELAIELCIADTTRIVCIREVQNSLKDSVRQLLVDKVQKLGVSHHFDITRDEIRGQNGSLIIFRGMSDANNENIKSLEGFDIAWVEEAHTLSEKSLELLRPTIRKPGSELWFSWNPRHKSDPVDRMFRFGKPPTNSVSVQVNYNDNPWFPAELRQEMEDDRAKDAKKAKHIWDGAYEAAPDGAYYGIELAEIETKGRIREFLPDPVLPVHTAWDMGVGGNMVTWFYQISGGEYRWLDFHEYEKPGLPHAASILKDKKREHEWSYGTHLWPHDGSSTDIGSGERRCDIFKKLGFDAEILPRTDVGDGIEATRRILKMSYFHPRCEKGLEHIRGYVRKHDKTNNRFLEEPAKNGHDHAADGLRTAAQGEDKVRNNMGAWDDKVMNFQMAGVV